METCYFEIVLLIFCGGDSLQTNVPSNIDQLCFRLLYSRCMVLREWGKCMPSGLQLLQHGTECSPR